jgi:hypothetical protein
MIPVPRWLALPLSIVLLSAYFAAAAVVSLVDWLRNRFKSGEVE